MDFLKAVQKRLPPILDEDDNQTIACLIQQLAREGWSVEETASYCRCFEEVNPQLPEDIALARIEEIKTRVKARLLATAEPEPGQVEFMGRYSGSGQKSLIVKTYLSGLPPIETWRTPPPLVVKNVLDALENGLRSLDAPKKNG